MRVKNGDKVVVKKEIELFGNTFEKVGNVFEVVEVRTNIIMLENDENVSLTVDKYTFEECFELYVEDVEDNENDDMSSYMDFVKEDMLEYNDLIEKLKNKLNAEDLVNHSYDACCCEPKMVTDEMVDDIISGSEIVIDTLFDRMTVVYCKLPNGFIISETSACIDPVNYDEDMGVEICMNKIIDKVYELEAYRLMSNDYETEKIGTSSCCECSDECCGCAYVNECFGY